MFNLPWLVNRLNEMANAHAQWVANAHAGVASLVAIVWTWPCVSRMKQRMPLKGPIQWVRLWRCPQCTTLNYQTYANCSHCEYRLQLGFWRRHIPILLSEKLMQSLESLGTQYSAVGWILFYGMTGALVWKLQFYRFPQAPPAELSACAVFLLALLSLWYFHRAFRPRWKSPLAFLMDGAMGAFVLYLAGFSLWLWSSAARDIALAGRLSRAYRWIPKVTLASPTPTTGKLMPLNPRPLVKPGT